MLAVLPAQVPSSSAQLPAQAHLTVARCQELGTPAISTRAPKHLDNHLAALEPSSRGAHHSVTAGQDNLGRVIRLHKRLPSSGKDVDHTCASGRSQMGQASLHLYQRPQATGQPTLLAWFLEKSTPLNLVAQVLRINLCFQ